MKKSAAVKKRAAVKKSAAVKKGAAHVTPAPKPTAKKKAVSYKVLSGGRGGGKTAAAAKAVAAISRLARKVAAKAAKKKMPASAANRGKNRGKVDNIVAFQFKPGQSGNPSGRPLKKPLTALYEQILDDPAVMEQVGQAVVNLLLVGNMATVLQLRQMAERVEGKVTQKVEAELTGQDGGPIKTSVIVSFKEADGG